MDNIIKTLFVAFIGYWLFCLGSARSQSIIDTRKQNIQEEFPIMINAGVTHIIIKDTLRHYNLKFINSKARVLKVLDLSDATIDAHRIYTDSAYSIKERRTIKVGNFTTLSPLNKLPDACFSNLTIKKIILPKNLWAIGGSIGWRSLADIPLFPDSLKEIGALAFSRCPLMKGNIILPPHIEFIGSGAFGGCALLTGVVKIPISMNLKRSSGCFNGCSGLDGVLFSEGSQYVFKDGFILTQDRRTVLSSSIPARPIVRLPKTIKEIHANAFSYDRIVEEIIIPKGVNKIGNRAFSSCYNLKKINLPEGLEEIGEEAFFECSISKLEIPSTVKLIKQTRWSGVDTLILKSSRPCILEENGNPKENFVIIVPKGTKKTYEKAVGWRQYKRFIR